jgi:hypothetical protein
MVWQPGIINATTFSITTFSMLTFSIMRLSITINKGEKEKKERKDYQVERTGLEDVYKNLSTSKLGPETRGKAKNITVPNAYTHCTCLGYPGIGSICVTLPKVINQGNQPRILRHCHDFMLSRKNFANVHHPLGPNLGKPNPCLEKS